MLTHGADRERYMLVMLALTDQESAELAQKTGKPPVLIPVGKIKLLPLQLEAGLAAGDVQSKLYDPKDKRWTATIAVSRYQ